MEINVVKEYFMKGDMRGAIAYLEQFPEMAEAVEKYLDIFEKEKYLEYNVSEVINQILRIYQMYFREVFYCAIGEEMATEKLLTRLSEYLGIHCMGEEERLTAIAEALSETFEKNGLHILTGKTNGHFGPYVWRSTEPSYYDVELPDGNSQYKVNILRGFIMRSWMDYLTFGEFGTGGWTDADGTINCVDTAYDFESDEFKISLLKHEAQHSEDLRRWPNMESKDLEYRAKLVELAYWKDHKLLEKFVAEGDSDRVNDGHAQASAKITDEMRGYMQKGVEEIRNKARELLAKDSAMRK